RQKSYADKHRISLEFQPGDHVFLKVLPARGVIRFGIKGKLSPRFIGPFEILDRVGEVSYRLALPPQLSHVHDVFHVSLLRGYKYHPLHVITLFRSSRFFGGTISSGKPLEKPRSLSGLLILISSHDMNKDKKNRLMQIDELHKFNDGMLTDVRTALDDRLKGIRIQYL
nr:putative reverse transcriptase domain-containing protein [Tanacetum cinerariifolium]